MRIVTIALLVLLILLLGVEAGFSLAWPIAHDEAPLFYEAFLMRAESRLPYRDLFDFQMPGTYAAFYGLGLLSAFDPLRIRVLDLILLTALLSVTLLILHGFGWKPALAAMGLFGLKYLEGGPSMALQREYLLLIFVALGIWFYMREGRSLTRRLLIGVCFGLAAVIKPQAAIGLLPILLFDLTDRVNDRGVSRLKAALATIVGLLIPVGIVFIWLGISGALKPFLDIVFNYWPLYAQINGQMEVTRESTRWLYVLDRVWRLGGDWAWIPPAVLGIFVALRKASLSERSRRHVWLFVWLAIGYALYPALSGQFFPYHYLPFVYFILLLCSLCLLEIKPAWWQAAATALLVFATLINVHASVAVMRQIEAKPIPAAGGRADKIAAYLESHLKPGDTVQPLDWTGGTLQAMLATRARLATSFVFDFYFYHHVTDPYIQGLRARFLEELRTAQPAYIVEVTAIDKPWISGPGTSRDFHELRAYLTGNYVVDVQKDDYVIYRRR